MSLIMRRFFTAVLNSLLLSALIGWHHIVVQSEKSFSYDPTSNHGRHFILGFIAQYSSHQDQGYNEISITAKEDANVTITSLQSDTPILRTFLKANRVLHKKVSTLFRMQGTNTERKGIEVNSTGNIAIFCLNYVHQTSDGYLALPTNILSTKYVIATYVPKDPTEANFGVVSLLNEATINITLNTTNSLTFKGVSYSSGETFSITLNKLETFHLSHRYDLSGTIVNSSKPVAVLSGNTCTYVDPSFCEHLVEYLLPVERWGKEYLLVPVGKVGKAGDLFRVFADENLTLILNENEEKNISSENFYEIDLGNQSSSIVKCNKPCQVIQYVKGYQSNGIEEDPSTIVLPSIKQFLNTYTLVFSGAGEYVNTITLVIEDTDINNLILNGTTFNATWQKINQTNYVWTVYELNSTVIVSHNKSCGKFGLLIFGKEFHQSYGYPGGFNFAAKDPDCIDVIKCGDRNGGCEQNCTNTPGSFLCSCFEGYHEDAKNSSACSDINECEDKSSCPAGFRCKNTPGSYKCICDGFSKDNICHKGVANYRVQMRLNENYDQQHNNTESQTYKNFSMRMSKAVKDVYKNNKNFIDSEIISLKNGSIIANLRLIFGQSDQSALIELLTAIRSNSFGNFNVDPDSFTVVREGSCTSVNSPCPANSTCQSLTSATYSCSCKEGFSSNGVDCIENVEVKVSLTIQRVYTPELAEESSQVYIELKKNVTAELYEVFKDTPNFEDVIVLGFRNGSVIVDFKVIYRKDPVLNKKVIVAETLKKKLFGKKTLGAFKLKSIQIDEKPPSPSNFTHDKVTEKQIHLVWFEPDSSEYFNIEGYLVNYKTVSESIYKEKRMSVKGSGQKNLVLDGLESDTFYVITVHGRNSAGDGEKSSLQVKTLKSDSNVVVIIVVVVIVVIASIVVAVLVFFFIQRRRSRGCQKRQQQARVVKMDEMSSKKGQRVNYSYGYGETTVA